MEDHMYGSKIQLPATHPAKVRSGCQIIFYDLTIPIMWPADCNHLDNYMWGVDEKDTIRASRNIKAQLINRNKVFEGLPRGTVKAASARLGSLIEAMLNSAGGFFEEIVL